MLVPKTTSGFVAALHMSKVHFGLFLDEFDKYASELHRSAPSTYTRPNGEVINMTTSLKSLYTLRGLVEEAQVIRYNELGRSLKMPPGMLKNTHAPFLVLKEGYKAKVGKTPHPILKSIAIKMDWQSAVNCEHSFKLNGNLAEITPFTTLVLPQSFTREKHRKVVAATVFNADVITGVELKRPSTDIPRSLFSGVPMSSLGFAASDLVALRNRHKYTSNNWVSTSEEGTVPTIRQGTSMNLTFRTISPITNEVHRFQSGVIDTSYSHIVSIYKPAAVYRTLYDLYNPLLLFSAPCSGRNPDRATVVKLDNYNREMGYFTGMCDANLVVNNTVTYAHVAPKSKQTFYNIDHLIKPLPAEVISIIKNTLSQAKLEGGDNNGGDGGDVSRSRAAKHISGMLDTSGVCVDGIQGMDLSAYPTLKESSFKDKLFFRTSDLLKYGLKTFPNAMPLRVNFERITEIGYTNIDESIDPLRSFVTQSHRLLHEKEIRNLIA